MPIGRLGDSAGSQIKAIVYGPSGVGKTYLTSQLTQVLILDFENGRLSMPPDIGDLRRADDPEGAVTATEIKEAFESDPAEVQSIRVPCKNVQQVGLVLQALRKSEWKNRFQAVVLDSVTTLTELVENDVLNRYPKLSRSIASNDGDSAAVMTMEGWMTVLDKVKRAIVQFRDVPIHVLFVLHEETRELDDGRAFTQPQLRGKTLLPAVQALVDYGFRIEVANIRQGESIVTQRRIRTTADQNVWAKARDFDGDTVLPFEEADLRKLIEKIAAKNAQPEGDA